jgi:hypothetical protein
LTAWEREGTIRRKERIIYLLEQDWKVLIVSQVEEWIDAVENAINSKGL